MAKIASVSAQEGNELIIELNNCTMILIELSKLQRDCRFAPIQNDNILLYPKTDGNTVYWENGPRLNLEDIFALISE